MGSKLFSYEDYLRQLEVEETDLENNPESELESELFEKSSLALNIGEVGDNLSKASSPEDNSTGGNPQSADLKVKLRDVRSLIQMLTQVIESRGSSCSLEGVKVTLDHCSKTLLDMEKSLVRSSSVKRSLPRKTFARRIVPVAQARELKKSSSGVKGRAA